MRIARRWVNNPRCGGIKRSERVDKCGGNETTGVKSGAVHRLTVFAAGESIKNEIRLSGDKRGGLNASEGVLENITN